MTTPRTHPHPPPPARDDRDYDVLVVGGGHAGIEAALAAARLGARAALVSFERGKIGEMSCNPAIGGLGKGQMVREIDALGGAMARVADATGIQFRMLNTGKGHAVRAPRCQSDRHRYRDEALRTVETADGVEIVEGGVESLLIESVDKANASSRFRVVGARTRDGRELRAAAVIITTGTFLRAIMHTGEAKSAGGRVGEASAEGLSDNFTRLGLRLGRLKTGTPPRLAQDGIEWDKLETQPGDERPVAFSWSTDLSDFPRLPQVPCHITWTNERTPKLVRDNIGRSPMYSGTIQGVGPRYCPAIEDKVVRFADKDRHQVFLEPEGLDTDVIYANGVSTSLPSEIQEAFVRSIDGLENARFLRHGYAVEYDFVLPSQLSDTLAVRSVEGLYLAGQINGTSGYEEAGCQGLMAGANAALWLRDEAPFVLGRHEAYTGVLIDDLTVANPTEPYRMFSSRAEFRLLLRQDNADRRLTPRAAEIGLVGKEAARAFEDRLARIEQATRLLNTLRGDRGKTLAEILRRPEQTLADLIDQREELRALQLGAELVETVEVDVKYAGYVSRQRQNVDRLERQEATEIPNGLDVRELKGLAAEAREKLYELKPRTLGAASRIAGVRPPDVALLAIHIEKWKREKSAAR